MENEAKTKQIIIEHIEKIAPGKGEEYFAGCNKHLEFMLAENKKYNLSGIKDYPAALERHLLDSIRSVDLALPYFRASSTILEPGSGGGFPGLPTAILFPSKKVTLVESIGKKANFLLQAKQQLQLKNLSVIQRRVEELDRDPAHREQYDLVISRALSSLPSLIELTVPLLKIGGVSIALKGKTAFTEINESKRALKELNAEIAETIPYSLLTPMDLMIVVVRKTDKTPEDYPREIGLPQNNPLV